MWRQKYSSQTGIINILGDTYFGEMYTEKRKSRGQTDALQQYGYHYSFEKNTALLGKMTSTSLTLKQYFL